MNYNLLIRDDFDGENIDMNIIDGGDDENDFLARFSSYVSSDANIKGAFEEEDEKEEEYIVNLEDDNDEEEEYIVNLDDKEGDENVDLNEYVTLDDENDKENEYIVNLDVDDEDENIPLDDNVFDEEEITVVGSSEFTELNDMLSKYSEFVYE